MARKKKTKKAKKAQRRRARRTAAPSREMSLPFKKFEERLLGFLKDEERDHFAIGLMWNQLTKQRWAETDLGQSPRTWWKEHVGSYCEPRTAVRLGRVVKYYKDPAVLAAEGDARLDDIITYCRKRRIKPPADPRPFPIDVTYPDGHKLTKPFSQCNAQEMEWAVRPPGRHPKRKPPPPPPPPSKPPPPHEPIGPATYWEDAYLGVVIAALDALGEETGDSWKEHGATFEYIGNKTCFTVRRIAWEHIRPLAKILIDSMPKAIEDGRSPLAPPVPDWLKGP